MPATFRSSESAGQEPGASTRATFVLMYFQKKTDPPPTRRYFIILLFQYFIILLSYCYEVRIDKDISYGMYGMVSHSGKLLKSVTCVVSHVTTRLV